MKKALLAVSAIVAIGGLALSSPANAVTSLTLENPGSVTYQQQLNSPCVIGENSCQQPAGFGETTIPANTANYDLLSPVYTVSDILTVLGGATTFFVGIDVNTTTSPLATEKLSLFSMLVNGAVAAIYNPATPTQLFTSNNGNGRSDELLKGFNLAGLSGGTTVQFEAGIVDATDGREQFFLINSGAPPIPEPASLLVLGAGLIGLGTVIRRRAA